MTLMRNQSKSVPGAPAPERHAGQCRVVVSGEPGEEVGGRRAEKSNGTHSFRASK